MKLAFSAAIAAAAAFSTTAFAAPPACSGHYELFRMDTVKPGKMALFLKAARDNQAWYAAHGLPDHIMIGRVPDMQSGGFSETTAYTTHFGFTQAGSPAHDATDAAWNTFVQEYKDSSDVANTALICLSPAS